MKRNKRVKLGPESMANYSAPTMTSVAQSAHLYPQGKADSDKYKAGLLDRIEEYNRAVAAWTKSSNELEASTRVWSQQSGIFQRHGARGQGDCLLTKSVLRRQVVRKYLNKCI